MVAARESKSRPDQGIVTFEHRGFNQRDELVCTARRNALDAPAAGMTSSVNPAPARIRSLLFAPASKPDVLRKLPRSTPDAVALDLEDAVPPDGKPAAREHAARRRRASSSPTTRASRCTCG